MANKKLTGKEFVKELEEKAESHGLKNVEFNIVSQKEENGSEETVIVVLDKNSLRFVCSFTYETTELIYNLSFGSIGFTELCDFTDLIRSVCESYNF